MGERDNLYYIEDGYLKKYGERIRIIDVQLDSIDDDINYLTQRLNEFITWSERSEIIEQLKSLRERKEQLREEKEKLKSTLRRLSQGPEF